MEEEQRRANPTLPTLTDPAELQADPYQEILGSAGLTVDADVPETKLEEISDRLEGENEVMQSESLCKMCLTQEVNVLFLPCGHLVACAQCAPALMTCAMCRQPVKGSVRVLLDDFISSGEESMDLDEAGEASGFQ